MAVRQDGENVAMPFWAAAQRLNRASIGFSLPDGSAPYLGFSLTRSPAFLHFSYRRVVECALAAPTGASREPIWEANIALGTRPA